MKGEIDSIKATLVTTANQNLKAMTFKTLVYNSLSFANQLNLNLTE
jgi:hypothetical protein